MVIQTTIQAHKRVFINPAKQNRMNAQEIKQSNESNSENNVVKFQKSTRKIATCARKHLFWGVLPSGTLKTGAEEREKGKGSSRV